MKRRKKMKSDRRVTTYRPERLAVYMPVDLRDRLSSMAAQLRDDVNRSQLINGLLRHCLSTMTAQKIRNVLGLPAGERSSDDTPSVFD